MTVDLADALSAAELTVANLSSGGKIEGSAGPFASLFQAGDQIAEALPLLAGLQSELEDIAAGTSPSLHLPNMSLPQAAPGETFDLRLAAGGGGLILALQARGQQAEVDQSLMQARNDLHLLARERDAARRAAEGANRTKDQLLLIMREHVRDPLASLCMTLDTLQPDLGLLDPTLADLAQASGAEARGVLRALDALVGASDAAAGLSALHAQEVSAGEAWRLLQRAGRKAKTDIPPNLGIGDAELRLALDPDKFEQLMECLLTLTAGAEVQVPKQAGPFWVISLTNLPEDPGRRAALAHLAQPTVYLQEEASQAEPTLLMATLLLRAMGLACFIEADRLELALPILQDAE